ncbi:N-acetyltransferase domain-containing protein [Vibrio chagasii]|nr:N-acetyltransferase domain-containing protein [Vibrio chagasii]CAH7057424.1 N-acetyltransferase domain-containing protein [Vibrio chagasii]CAH7244289.1 N-acetyltransferase domain-containing protein [Vibrio chagasii]
MQIRETTIEDLGSVIELVASVSQADILPHFNEEGRETFLSKVLPDVKTSFNKDRFETLKVIDNGKLVGFGAIRDRDYITHLFIENSYQGTGLGKLLLEQLLKLSNYEDVRLRASVNAVNFYESQGFKATDKETQVNGIRFVPMSRSST